MKKLLVVLINVVLLVLVVAACVPIDPEERRPGLNLSGELAEEQNPDWSFLKGRTKIYVQMSTWYLLPHSITTVSWVHDNQLYVPCGRCATKNWPNHVARNNEVRLKVQGQLYDRSATRLIDEDAIRTVMGVSPGAPLPDGVWVYRMDPR